MTCVPRHLQLEVAFPVTSRSRFGIKKYSCPQCNKSFSEKNYLNYLKPPLSAMKPKHLWSKVSGGCFLNSCSFVCMSKCQEFCYLWKGKWHVPIFHISMIYISWRTRKPALIPLTHPRFASARPVVPPKGATTVPKFFVLGIFELRSVDGSTIWEKCVVDRPHTSPQPTRGDGQLKKLYNLIGLKNGNVTCGHNWMVPDGSHAQI